MLKIRNTQQIVFCLLTLTLVSAIYLRVEESHSASKETHNLQFFDDLVSWGQGAIQTVGQTLNTGKDSVLTAGSTALGFIEETSGEAIQSIKSVFSPNSNEQDSNVDNYSSQKFLSEKGVPAPSVDSIMAKVIEAGTINQRQCLELEKQCIKSIVTANQAGLLSKCDQIGKYCLFKSNQPEEE